MFAPKKKLKLLTFFWAMMTTCFAFPLESPWTHFGLRPLGMGNAFVAVADDYNALFYNPAGLARLTDWSGELINPGVDVSKNTIAFAKQVRSLQGSSSQNLSNVLTVYKEESGKSNHASFFLTPYFVAPNWGMGLGLTLGADFVLHSNVNIDFRGGTDIILPIAVAGSFVNKKLSLGVATKLVSFDGINDNLSIETLSAVASKGSKATETLQELVRTGVGVGVDVGLLFTPVPTMRPTLGMSVLDVGGTTYRLLKISSLQTSPPKNRPPAVNMGVSLMPIEGEYGYVLFAADVDCVNRPTHYSQKLNLGMEIGLGSILKLQTGLMAGYATGGIQIDLKLLKIRFATYAVDRGPVVGLDKDLVDRRYVIQVNLLI